MRLFIKHACDRICIIRSVKVSLIVGTILGLINHSDAIISGTFGRTNIIQVALTYLVPFCVSTFGSAMQARHIELQNCSGQKKKHKMTGSRQ